MSPFLSEITFVQDPRKTLAGVWPCLDDSWMDHILQVIIIIVIAIIVTI